MNLRSTALAVLIMSASLPAEAQETTMHSGALEVALARLQTTARVLYVAAHPDDENTRLLAYLANKRQVEVGYLSLTRGGGGQNLIGTEQSELLAAIRTQELLAARRLDGARQFFTRARDFGYSKSPKEALAKWGEEAVLGDVVHVIRSFRPDIIITRFTEAGPSHGHHTASARLARAAVGAAADPSQFPQQLKAGLEPHKVHRLMLNVPRWGRQGSDTAGMLTVDVGGYDSRLGLSYPEIAALSRTMHKSQGFGSAGRRGPVLEYFQTLEGPAANDDLFDGLTLDWSRYKGGEAVQSALSKVKLRANAPEQALSQLLKARQAMSQLPDRAHHPVIGQRLRDLDGLVGNLLGLHIRAEADRPEVTPGQRLPVRLSITLRRPAALQLKAVQWSDARDSQVRTLQVHQPLELTHQLQISSTRKPTAPPWLSGRITSGLYASADFAHTLDAQAPGAETVRLDFETGSHRWSVQTPVVHSRTDRVHGERLRAVTIVPPLTVTPVQTVIVMPQGEARPVALMVRSGREKVRGTVGLELPEGWSSEPTQVSVHLEAPGQERQVSFNVRPPSAQAAPVSIQPYVLVDGVKSHWRHDLIDHPHIPVQTILRDASLRLVPMRYSPPKGRIGYVPGSGDTIAELLQATGVRIEQLPAAELSAERLEPFDVIVLGIRAFNTQPEALAAAHPALMRWVQAGGRLVVQYNTSNRWRPLTAEVGPYPLKIDRGRVTDEFASMKVLQPKHRLLNHPHRIDQADFEGWVQERGLYFASSWDAKYTPIFEAHDAGEAPLQGSLLYTNHGKGSFIYTGLSFFRQLPAGVPGAYRLLANLLSPERVDD